VPDPTIPTAGHIAVWLEWTQDEGFDGPIWWGLPETSFAPPTTVPTATEPPARPQPDPSDGTLQVLEPPTSLGLLDTIVGDVVASYLGK
jgi:hypothetical protein